MDEYILVRENTWTVKKTEAYPKYSAKHDFA